MILSRVAGLVMFWESMKMTSCPASTKEVAMLIAIVSLGVPGGPETSSIWPPESPPDRRSSKAGDFVDIFAIFSVIDAADWVRVGGISL